MLARVPRLDQLVGALPGEGIGTSVAVMGRRGSDRIGRISGASRWAR